jgi:ribosomal protein S18 acetylase RimI-like enzyme
MELDEVLERTQRDLFWLPEGVQVVDRPEIFYLAAPGSRDGYLNTVLRVRAEAPRFAALVDEVDRAHDGVDSRWMLAGASRSTGIERALAARGYALAHEHDGYAIGVDDHAGRATKSVTARAVETLDDLRAALDVLARAFDRPALRGTAGEGENGEDGEAREAARLAQLLGYCTGPNARVHRFVAWDDASGAPIATGAMNTFPDLGDGFGFLWGGGTVPEGRGRGAYSALVSARIARARALGLRHVGLYARRDTSAPIVAAQRFRKLGPMDYWERKARVAAASSASSA